MVGAVSPALASALVLSRTLPGLSKPRSAAAAGARARAGAGAGGGGLRPGGGRLPGIPGRGWLLVRACSLPGNLRASARRAATAQLLGGGRGSGHTHLPWAYAFKSATGSARQAARLLCRR